MKRTSKKKLAEIWRRSMVAHTEALERRVARLEATARAEVAFRTACAQFRRAQAELRKAQREYERASDEFFGPYAP